MGKLKEMLTYTGLHGSDHHRDITNLVLVGAVGAVVLAGNLDDYYFPADREPFRSALAAYRNKPDDEERCNRGAETYIRRIIEESPSGKAIKIIERELTCDRVPIPSFFSPSLILDARLTVAERELFPDGRIEVTIGPWNEYQQND